MTTDDNYSQRNEASAGFKECKICRKIWGNYHEFLSDSHISLIGYQVNFDILEAGFLLFNHSCNNTLAVPVKEFRHLYTGPVFKERATGTDTCPGFCLYKEELDPCPAECECAYVREILQIVRHWSKEENI